MPGSDALLGDLAVMLAVAAAVTVVFRLVRQPPVLGYLLAGLLVGDYVPIPVFVRDVGRIQTLSELGVVLVMFAIGLHVSVRKLLKLLPTAGLTCLIQIGGMLWLGYAIGRGLGWTATEALFAGAVIAISSTMVASRALDEVNADATWRELVFGVLIVQDLGAVLLIAVFTTLAQGGAAGGEMAATALDLAGFLIITVAVGMLVVPRVVRRVVRLGSNETLLIVAIGFAFALALLAHELGFSVALGAFLAGSLIAESGHGEEVERLVAPVRDLFAAVFFIAIGMMVDPRAIAAHWPAVLALSLAVIVGQTTLVTVGTFLGGNGLRRSLRTGVSLAQIGEFSFIIVGVAGGAVGGHLFPVAVAVAAVTSFATTVLVGRAVPIARAIEARLPSRVTTFAALYVSWREDLRRRPPRGKAALRLRRLVVLLLADAAALAGVGIGATIVSLRHAAALAAWSALDVRVVHGFLAVAACVVGVPLAIGLVRCAGAIGALLADRVLPAAQQGALDLAAAPRRALIVTFRLAATLAIGLPLFALSQAFMPAALSAALLAVVLVVQTIAFWRGAENLEQHVVAGTQLMLEVLARQASPTEDARALDAVGERLPGLGNLLAVRLEAGSPAVGATLVNLDLRGRTGATVLAIRRVDGDVLSPTGREVLAIGDVLTITGGAAAVADARTILGTGSTA